MGGEAMEQASMQALLQAENARLQEFLGKIL